MNPTQREAIERYAAEPGIDEVAGAALELALECGQSTKPIDEDPSLADPARRAALIARVRRDNQRRAASELAIHNRIMRTQLPDIRCTECGLTGWIRRVPHGFRCHSCSVMFTSESLVVPT